MGACRAGPLALDARRHSCGAGQDGSGAAGIESRTEYYLHAMLLQFTGQLAEAEAVLLETLQRWPDHGEAAVIALRGAQATVAAAGSRV